MINISSIIEYTSGNSSWREAILLEIIDQKKDSLRFYYLGNHYESKIEHYGVKDSFEQEGVLIL